MHKIIEDYLLYHTIVNTKTGEELEVGFDDLNDAIAMRNILNKTWDEGYDEGYGAGIMVGVAGCE